MNVVNFGSKQCERIRRQLDAYLSNELLVETTAEVLKHLETCQACSAEAESRMHVREALRQAVDKRVAPEHLGDAVRSRLRRAEREHFWQSPAMWAVAVGLALVVFAGSVGQ